MALANTWYYTFNDTYAPASALDMGRYILWHTKAFLKGELTYVDQTNTPVALPVGVQWTCEGSSDGVTGAHDGVDRWTNVYNGALIVRGGAGVAHSWITLTSPTIKGKTWYMLISFDGSNDYSVTVAFSPIAFTGGTATATPTSSLSWGFANGSVGAIQFFNNANAAHKFHSGTSNGSGFYLLWGQSGGAAKSTALLMFRALEGVTVGEIYPIFSKFGYNVSGLSSTSAVLGSFWMGQIGNYYGCGMSRGMSQGSSARVTYCGILWPYAYFGGSWLDGSYFVGPDYDDSKYPVWTCYVIETDRLGYPVHIKGRISDMYEGECNLADGTTAPSVGTNEYALFNSCWMPAPTAPTF